MFSLLPCCYLFKLNLALCCTCEWMKPCCSLLRNNIKCHVSLNLQTWNTSFQLYEQFLHVILNALCRSRVLIAVQSIVQWPSSVLCMQDIKEKTVSFSPAKWLETCKCFHGPNILDGLDFSFPLPPNIYLYYLFILIMLQYYASIIRPIAKQFRNSFDSPFFWFLQSWIVIAIFKFAGEGKKVKKKTKQKLNRMLDLLQHVAEASQVLIQFLKVYQNFLIM